MQPAEKQKKKRKLLSPQFGVLCQQSTAMHHKHLSGRREDTLNRTSCTHNLSVGLNRTLITNVKSKDIRHGWQGGGCQGPDQPVLLVCQAGCHTEAGPGTGGRCSGPRPPN